MADSTKVPRVAHEVARNCGVRKAAFLWVREVEAEGVSFKQLRRTGAFDSSDAKLSTALNKIMLKDLARGLRNEQKH